MLAPATSASAILVVDDDRVALSMLEAQLQAAGYHVLTAANGQMALELARQQGDAIDSVVLDRRMPHLDGLEVVHAFKQEPALQWMPIIMVTASDSPQEIREGIDAGVFYYLTKPVQEPLLQSVVAAAVRERQHVRQLIEAQQQQTLGFHLIDTARFRLRSLPEAESLAVFLSHSFPDPRRSVVGLAELLINAVEHGNLNIGYEEKTNLLSEGTWREEVMRRAALPEYREKEVEVLLQRKEDGVYVQITDQGEGFDWKSYLMIDPSRTTDNHGRGIAQANAQSFDALRYNAKGNQVLAMAAIASADATSALEW